VTRQARLPRRLKTCAHAMTLMAGLIREGQRAGEVRDGDPGALAHLGSVLINEYATD
jgi:hypothetical protein